jgi:hypothetical protein
MWASMSPRGPAAPAALPAGDSVITRPRARHRVTAGPGRKPVSISHQNFRWR